MVSCLLLLVGMNSHAGETTLISVDSVGQQGNGTSSPTSMSADGRRVAFFSDASNLVAGDTNERRDCFVHDRMVGTTSRVSVDSAGVQANGSSTSCIISADGRFVAFSSVASNLVGGDTNGTSDIFVRNLADSTTALVSVNSAGTQQDDESYQPTISADGRFVAFFSDASNLVEGDTNSRWDVFVHDRATGNTTRVSVSSAGSEANGFYISDPVISADGRFVAFTSDSSNLVEADTNGRWDIFVHDRAAGTTHRVSVSSSGEQGAYDSGQASINADGRFVVFLSSSTNLVTEDNNEKTDVFVHDRILGITTLASVNSEGLQGNDHGFGPPTISADGRFVGFRSLASNFVAGDTNGLQDIFVHDRATGETTRSSVDSQGNQQLGNFHALYSHLSADGRFVAFGAGASNLVAGDTNGLFDAFVRDRQLNTAKTADLQLAVTSQPASVQKGQDAHYTYTVTNNGPNSIGAEVKLTGVISKGRFISLTPSQGSCSKAAVSVCRFGHLESGSSVTLAAVVKAGRHPLTQQLSVNAPPVDHVPGNNSVTVSTLVTP